MSSLIPLSLEEAALEVLRLIWVQRLPQQVRLTVEVSFDFAIFDLAVIVLGLVGAGLVRRWQKQNDDSARR